MFSFAAFAASKLLDNEHLDHILKTRPKPLSAHGQMRSGQVSATAQVMAELFERSRNGVDLHVRGRISVIWVASEVIVKKAGIELVVEVEAEARLIGHQHAPLLNERVHHVEIAPCRRGPDCEWNPPTWKRFPWIDAVTDPSDLVIVPKHSRDPDAIGDRPVQQVAHAPGEIASLSAQAIRTWGQRRGWPSTPTEHGYSRTAPAPLGASAHRATSRGRRALVLLSDARPRWKRSRHRRERRPAPRSPPPIPLVVIRLVC